MKTAIVVFAILFIIANQAMCDDKIVDGNLILEHCIKVQQFFEGRSSADSSKAGICVGYIQGARDMHDVYQFASKATPLFCIPSQVPNGQLVRILLKYLQSHPEKLHLNGGFLCSLAFVEAFPCK